MLNAKPKVSAPWAFLVSSAAEVPMTENAVENPEPRGEFDHNESLAA